jgi:hypothetical protein
VVALKINTVESVNYSIYYPPFAVILTSTAYINGQSADSLGTEFVTAFMRNHEVNSNENLDLTLTFINPNPTTATVTVSGQFFSGGTQQYNANFTVDATNFTTV